MIVDHTSTQLERKSSDAKKKEVHRKDDGLESAIPVSRTDVNEKELGTAGESADKGGRRVIAKHAKKNDWGGR